MECLVVYDIPDDRLRHRVSEACLDYGLTRVQYSAFRGRLTRSRQEELLQRVRRILGQEEGSVQIYPLCRKDLALFREVRTGGYRPGRRRASS